MVVRRPQAREKGVEHATDRRRLPLELSGDCIFMEETGECGEQELNHNDGQAEKFYRDLKPKSRNLSLR